MKEQPVVIGEPVSFIAARIRHPYKEKVKGHRIEKPLPNWARWAVYFFVDTELWYVIELGTGWAVGKGTTNVEAVQNALLKLTKAGRRKLYAKMAEVPVLNPEHAVKLAEPKTP